MTIKHWGKAAGLACGALAVGAFIHFNRTEPKAEEPRGTFFRINIDVEYRGKPHRISYVTACSLVVSRQIDGDRSVDGAGIVPMLWGERMDDGGSIVVKTPEFCYGQTTENGKVKPGFMPLLIHFENADQPWFGRGYMSDDAYDSPLSVMRFGEATIEKASYQDWRAWREGDSKKNTVRYELTELTDNFLKRKTWSPGTQWMPMRCGYAAVREIPKNMRKSLEDLRPSNKPEFWRTRQASDYLQDNRKSIYGYSSHNETAIRTTGGIGPFYPMSSNAMDLDNLNELLSTNSLTQGDIQYNVAQKGFAYCNQYDHPRGAPKAFYTTGNYKFNGISIETNTKGFPQDRAALGNSYFVEFGWIQLPVLGGKL